MYAVIGFAEENAQVGRSRATYNQYEANTKQPSEDVNGRPGFIPSISQDSAQQLVAT